MNLVNMQKMIYQELYAINLYFEKYLIKKYHI